nr:hypothetical protein [Methyloglobulus morosus]
MNTSVGNAVFLRQLKKSVLLTNPQNAVPVAKSAHGLFRSQIMHYWVRRYGLLMSAMSNQPMNQGLYDALAVVAVATIRAKQVIVNQETSKVWG